MEAISYTQLKDEDVRAILACTEFGELETAKELRGGFANSSFMVATPKGKWLLKVCDEKTYDELKVQIDVLGHMKKNSALPACYPHRFTDGSSILLYGPEKKKIVFYDFLEGQPGTPPLTPAQARDIGKALGQLHSIPPIDCLPPFPMGLAAIIPFLESLKGTPWETHDFVRLLGDKVKGVQEIPTDALGSAILHGDIFPDNAMFVGDSLSGIIDFEEVCHGPPVLDVGMTIIGCCFEGEVLRNDVVCAFLSAYCSVRPLSDAEWRALVPFSEYAALSVAYWRFRQFNVLFPHETNRDRYLDMVSRMEAVGKLDVHALRQSNP